MHWLEDNLWLVPIEDRRAQVDRLTKLLTNNRLYGNFMATTQAALRSVAQKLGVKQLANTA